jgi:4a-hydroxytetrahydrobiopterin dehydratase
MDRLDDDAIQAGLAGLGWERDADALVKVVTRKDFAEAMAFVNAVAEAAEAANHHPDILVHGWNKVRLTVTNHSAGGITDKDLELAGQIDRL